MTKQTNIEKNQFSNCHALTRKICKATLTTVMLAGVSACGCFPGLQQTASGNSGAKKPQIMIKTELTDKNSTKISAPQVQAKWQRKFVEMFEKRDKKTTDAWALFSYGGWSDEGQIIIFGSDNKAGVSLYAKPGSKEVNFEDKMTVSDLKPFFDNDPNFSKLDHFDSGTMDGIQYEYVRASRDQQGAVKILKRIFMNNPGIGKPAPGHELLVKTFVKYKRK